MAPALPHLPGCWSDCPFRKPAPGDNFPCEDSALAWLILRPARLERSSPTLHLYFPLSLAELPVRLGCWDIDPGVNPWTGQVNRFFLPPGAGMG